MRLLIQTFIVLFSFCCFSCNKKSNNSGAVTSPPTPVVLPTATVNLNNVKQQLVFMGGDMERSANAVQNTTNKNDIINWGFGDIPFNICRMQYDKNQEMVEGVKNFSFYNGTVQSMKDIKLVNPSIKFMASMRSDYDGFNQGDTNNLPTWIYNRQTTVLNVPKYAKFLADYVAYMSQQGVPVDYLSTAKEWTSVVKPDSAVKLINILKTDLQTRGVAMPLIMDPASWSITNGIDYVNRIKQLGETAQVFAFCTHNYNTAETKTYKNYFDAVAPTGKPAFHDETSTGGGGRFTPAGINPPIQSLIDVYKEKVDMYHAGFSGEIFFEIWSRGINAESRSIYFPSGGTGVRRRAYYVMKEFASFALNASYVPVSFTNSTALLSGMAFKKGNKVMLVLLNESGTTTPAFKLSFQNAIVNGAVTTLLWNEAVGDAGVSSTVTAVNNNKDIQFELKEKSIMIVKCNVQ